MDFSCKEFFARSGWHCQALPATTSAAASLYVSTPLVLSDRKPLDFYVSQSGNLVTISDDGSTMFALRSLGIELSDRRNWRTLATLAKSCGFELSEQGEFLSVRPESEFAQFSADVLSLFAGVVAWERERNAEGDADFSLTNEVEQLLAANAPDRRITPTPTVRVGAMEVEFDFLWGELFVDAVRPVANSVNPRLRKGVLMRRMELERQVLFIVDDSRVPEKAQTELSVLGALAPAVALSSFRAMDRRYEPLPAP